MVDLARDERAGDTVFEQDGVRIYVDADSLALVDGTEIDFLKQGLNEQFVFRNPNVAGGMRLRRELHDGRRQGRLSRRAFGSAGPARLSSWGRPRRCG